MEFLGRTCDTGTREPICGVGHGSANSQQGVRSLILARGAADDFGCCEDCPVRLLLITGLCLAAAPATAQEPIPGAVTFFETKIRPVLVGRCFKCHGAQKATNGLRVDSRKALLK